MSKNLISKSSLAERFGVSRATIANWLKTGFLAPPASPDGYTQGEFEAQEARLRASSRLKQRANRSRAGKAGPVFLGIRDPARRQTLLDALKLCQASRGSGDPLVASLMGLAQAMLAANHLKLGGSRLEEFLIQLLGELDQAPAWLFVDLPLENRDDDLLGAFYQSLLSQGSRAISGSYYTPVDLLDGLKIRPDQRVIDPCCGSGGLLLATLSKEHNPGLITACDTDPLALAICAVNLALFFNDLEIQPRLELSDILLRRPEPEGYDLVLTNPPWGARLTASQKKALASHYPKLKTNEVFGAALSQGIKLLKPGGELAIFLPRAFLETARHRELRQLVLAPEHGLEIQLLGPAFEGVQSEGILLRLKTDQPQTDPIRITRRAGESHQLARARVKPGDYLIPAELDEFDWEIIDQVDRYSVASLSNEAIFALGIVTGDNEKFLFDQAGPGREAIFRGREIQPYRLDPPARYIEFRPQAWQQVAPLEFYRSEKIVYRFIADRPICALDQTGALLLNSANLLISPGYPMPSLIALFNSELYGYLYRKLFASKKILRSQLESLPLPGLSRAQHRELAGLVERADEPRVREAIEAWVYQIFGLKPIQIQRIKAELRQRMY